MPRSEESCAGQQEHQAQQPKCNLAFVERCDPDPRKNRDNAEREPCNRFKEKAPDKAFPSSRAFPRRTIAWAANPPTSAPGNKAIQRNHTFNRGCLSVASMPPSNVVVNGRPLWAGPRPDFVAIVKGEAKIRPSLPRKSLVRTGLTLERPADPVESCEYLSGLGRRPQTHAAAMPIEMG
jgi:hypothetical protein